MLFINAIQQTGAEKGAHNYEGKNKYLVDFHTVDGFTDFLYWGYRIFHDLYGKR
jgi:hypothetical protein